LNRYGWVEGNHFGLAIQMAIWMVGGLSVTALAATALRQWQDSGAWLLALWVGGIVAFAAFAYWMVNGRVILPLAPAAAILVARGLQEDRARLGIGIKCAVLAGAGLSLLAAQADFQQAYNTRSSVKAIADKFAGQDTRIWFQGHWGFQHYMQQAGGWAVDYYRKQFKEGDLMVMPAESSNNVTPRPDEAVPVGFISMPAMKGFAIMKLNVGAGFYSHFWGPLPFAFGMPADEKYVVYRVIAPRQGGS
jgi:hypothetical protein